MDDITEDTLNDLVHKTFRFEAEQPQAPSLSELIRRRHKVGGAMLRPVQFNRPLTAPKPLPQMPEVQIERQTLELDVMEF